MFNDSALTFQDRMMCGQCQAWLHALLLLVLVDHHTVGVEAYDLPRHAGSTARLHLMQMVKHLLPSLNQYEQSGAVKQKIISFQKRTSPFTGAGWISVLVCSAVVVGSSSVPLAREQAEGGRGPRVITHTGPGVDLGSAGILFTGCEISKYVIMVITVIMVKW